MTRAERPRGNCRVCGREGAITDEGGLRHHFTENEEWQAGPDSRKCRGVGQPPAVPDPGPDEPAVQGYVCRVPAAEGCGLQVQLTSNGRARSHLQSDMRTPCPGGSDWPLRVDPQGNRHDTAPGSEPRPAVGPEGLRMGSDDPLVDFLGTASAGAGTVLDHLGFDPRDPDGPGEVPAGEGAACARTGPGCQGDVEYARTPTHRRGAWLCTVHRAPGLADVFKDDADNRTVTPGRVTMEPLHDPAGLFDPTHVLTTDAGPEVHPGEAGDCSLPGCCTHPQGFTYGDDGEGHSGSFCADCGTEEPDRCICDQVDYEGPARDCPVHGEDVWRTPADILERMPAEVQYLAALNPECWNCGHEVIPLAERFEPSGSVRHVVWDCSRHCSQNTRPGHIGQECRPQRPGEARLLDLDEGEFFIRHITQGSGLVYRAGRPTMGPLAVTVVSPGPHHGRTGALTNLNEEILCTDQHGRPRPRRTPSPAEPTGPGASSTPTTGPRSRPPSPPTVTPTRAPSPGEKSLPATSSGPTEKAAGSTPSAPGRSALPDAFSTPKEAVKESDKYDRFGRYKLTHPDSGKAVKWTRATTFAKSVQDTYALSMWSQRMTLKGASLRSDIVAAVSTLDVKQDKDRVNALVEDAKKAAGDKVAANKGTAVHAFTEDRDKSLVGEPVRPKPVPEEFVPTVDAYEAILAAFGLEPVPGLIEFTTAVKQYEVAGTSDRVYRVTRDITFQLNGRSVTLYAGEYVIGDVKTGADLSYGWQEIAIQLALYAQGLNTSGVWSWEHGRWGKPSLPDSPEVLLKVRTDVGLVPHLPVDRTETGAPLATLYAVDLDAGWAATVLCAQVRTWRKERKLAVPLEVADVVEGKAVPVTIVGNAKVASQTAVASRPATLEDRARAVTSRAEASAVFREAKAARTPVDEVKRLVALMQAKLESFVEQGA